MTTTETARIAAIIRTLRIEPEHDPKGENIDAIFGGPVTKADIADFSDNGFDGYAEGMIAGLADLAEIVPARDWLRVWKLDAELTEGGQDWTFWERLAA